MAMAAALLLLLLAAPVIYATNHTVGGSSGWDTGVNYTAWASGQTFTVGDYLVFTYGSTHSVDQVTQTNYDNCGTSNPTKSYSGGSNTIALTTSGSMYFLCPTIGHCSQGMKLAISVVSNSGSTSPPSNSSSPSPPPPPRNSSSSSPSGATSKFCSMSHLMVGLVLGFGMMFALVV
ncbi:hypothetical protein PVL29_019763 [Vitis rotundifolia]|uniref:Phytocyanin domain-containing protein n=1 Tax=Vitis rotundifolia TaxID=103349 RepID=A0AA38Z1G7_VITRO|nr:hypothetical protein PVL29_019763 [Vitis rotundifolia]